MVKLPLIIRVGLVRRQVVQERPRVLSVPPEQRQTHDGVREAGGQCRQG